MQERRQQHQQLLQLRHPDVKDGVGNWTASRFIALLLATPANTGGPSVRDERTDTDADTADGTDVDSTGSISCRR
jgi:hypothetical protein